MGFGGKSYDAPPPYVPPTPEKTEISKPVTEAASAARQNQKEKAARATGISGSILTSPVKNSELQSNVKNLLGQ